MATGIPSRPNEGLNNFHPNIQAHLMVGHLLVSKIAMVMVSMITESELFGDYVWGDLLRQ